MNDTSKRRASKKRFAALNSISHEKAVMILRLIHECQNPGLRKQACVLFKLWNSDPLLTSDPGGW